jgi:hypothetical protein
MLAAILMLAAAAPLDAPTATVVARLGQTVRLADVRVTPLQVIEDSRCPRLVACVWRGRLRLTAAVGGARVTLDDGIPVTVRGGHLLLVDAEPLSQRGEKIPPRAYRFRFRLQR